MPRFDLALSAQANLATSITLAGETMRQSGGSLGKREWSIVRLEALYELAYLRVFAAWETLLEDIFLRSLCGYATTAGGQETLVGGAKYFTSIAAAEAHVLGGKQFMLWHNPAVVIARCRQHIDPYAPGCPRVQELTIASSINRLVHLSAIRHRIVHDQADALNKFNAATVAIAAGRLYAAGRPGKFLRDWDNSIPRKRWLSVLLDELISYASQMV
jgi:hypothetical protein